MEQEEVGEAGEGQGVCDFAERAEELGFCPSVRGEAAGRQIVCIVKHDPLFQKACSSCWVEKDGKTKDWRPIKRPLLTVHLKSIQNTIQSKKERQREVIA